MAVVPIVLRFVLLVFLERLDPLRMKSIFGNFLQNFNLTIGGITSS